MPRRTPLELCSLALTAVGADPITSFDSGTVEAEVASLWYPMTAEALLSSHYWSFALRRAELAELAAPSDAAGWDYAYALPADFLRLQAVGTDATSQGVPFEVRGAQLLTDEAIVEITYVRRASEDDWPGYFQDALVAQLAANFAIPLTENTERAEVLTRHAEVKFVRAKQADDQGKDTRAIKRFPLTDAR